MEMTNLKVTMFLDTASPVLLNRFTTIDSILLSAYYGYKSKKGIRLPYDPNHESVDFIHKEGGVFSGSIWYIARGENIYLDFHKIVKKAEHRKIFDMTRKKTASNANFKPALIQDELMIVKKIHFYIRGSMEHIETLLDSEVSSIGQKQRLGLGMVERIEVEEIEEDKGYMLNPTTASKPLPISDFDVKSKKIAFFRRSAPYWETEGREACYMPTSALYEMVDKSDSSTYKVAKNLEYITNTDFIYDVAKGIEKKDFIPFSLNLPPVKKDNFEYAKKDTPSKCVFSSSFANEGMYGDLANFMRRWKKSFGDVAYMKRGDFIASKTLWCLDNLPKISYALVSKGDKEWHYLQGKAKKEGETINDYIVNHKKFKPPFSINLKDTANAQHVSFKGRVSVSTAFYYVQYGDKTLQVDTELLISAIKDITRITEKYPNISKTHLCGSFKNEAFHPILKRTSTDFERAEVMEFHKKYNSDLRNYMNVVAFNTK